MHLFPEQASTVAGSVDSLYFFLLISCGTLAILLAILVIVFALKFHRRSPNEVPRQVRTSVALEVGWSSATFVLFMVIFYWGARLYYGMGTPPPNAIEIYAIGKQWMWKVQHPGGQREINELHVPVGTPVRITMTSQDVIHSFYVPAFRVKQDAVPGRYTTLWFEATKPGKYHLFCSEYCGAKHSGMTGWVYALAPAEYSRWLTSGAAEGSLAAKGQRVFHQYGCSTCHDFGGGGPGPSLKNVYGRRVRIENGPDVLADDAYIRESILDAKAKTVYGFAQVMPLFQGQITEEEVVQLIEYVKSLAAPPAGGMPSSSGETPEDWGTDPGITQPGVSSITGSKTGKR